MTAESFPPPSRTGSRNGYSLVQAAVLLGIKHLVFKAAAEDEERLEAKLDGLLRAQGIDPESLVPEDCSPTPH